MTAWTEVVLLALKEMELSFLVLESLPKIAHLQNKSKLRWKKQELWVWVLA